MHDLRDGVALLAAVAAVVTIFVGSHSLGAFCGGVFAGLLLAHWLEAIHVQP